MSPMGKLHFSLPDEEEEFQSAVNAPRYRAVIRAMLESLRNERKHGDHGEDAQEMLDTIWERLWSELSAEGLTEEF